MEIQNIVVLSILLFIYFLLNKNNNALVLLGAMRRRRRQRDAEILEVLRLDHPIHFLGLPVPPFNTRKIWMKVRSRDWWNRIVLQEFTDEDWKSNFRVSRRSFVKLCGLTESFMSPNAVTVREAIPLQMRVAIVLYRLGSSGEYRMVANQFGVHKCTVKKFVYMFCNGMLNGPLRELIKMPKEEEAIEIARRFEAAHGIPQIIGLIDGTHIPVLPPSNGYRDFVNRKGWPSYVLQAVVDDRCW